MAPSRSPDGETPDDPTGREKADHDHHRRFDQFRRSGADTRDDQQDANGAEYKTGPEDEGEIEHGRFENLHLQLIEKIGAKVPPGELNNHPPLGFDTVVRWAYIEIHRTAPLAGLHFYPVL